MKKRICNIICDITSGGVESVLQNYFSHMDTSDYELDLVTYGIHSYSCAEKFTSLGFNIIEVPPKRKGFFRSVCAMYDVIKAGNYDIVHAHLTEWNCIPMFLAFLCGVKQRISHSHMSVVPTATKDKVLLCVQKVLNVCFANIFCACGEDAAKYLYDKKRFNQNKVVVLHNAIEVERFLPNVAVRKEMRKELGIADSTFCVGHIGRFLEQKNHTFLIDIFKSIVDKQLDSCLLLLGTGELESTIKDKVCRLGLEQCVRFLGVRNDVDRLYQAMDVFCLPSLYEGLPVVGVEAQAAQLPCVISDKISAKVKVTANVHLMSLNCSVEEWAEAILLCKREEGKLPEYYMIDKAVKMWENLYKI